MKAFIITLTILSMCFYGCKNTAKHNHEHETAAEHAAHTHEGHNHEHEELQARY